MKRSLSSDLFKHIARIKNIFANKGNDKDKKHKNTSDFCEQEYSEDKKHIRKQGNDKDKKHKNTSDFCEQEYSEDKKHIRKQGNDKDKKHKNTSDFCDRDLWEKNSILTSRDLQDQINKEEKQHCFYQAKRKKELLKVRILELQLLVKKDFDFLRHFKDLSDQNSFSEKFIEKLSIINKPLLTNDYSSISIKNLNCRINKVCIETILDLDKEINKSYFPCLRCRVNEKLHDVAELLKTRLELFNNTDFIGHIEEIIDSGGDEKSLVQIIQEDHESYV